MRNIKEIDSILSAIYCINLSKRENADNNIELICKYAFNRLFNGNPNLLIFSCIGKTEEQIVSEVKQLMYENTEYKKYEEWKNFQEEKRNEQHTKTC